MLTRAAVLDLSQFRRQGKGLKPPGYGLRGRGEDTPYNKTRMSLPTLGLVGAPSAVSSGITGYANV